MNVAVAGCLRSSGGRWTVASVRGSPYLASTFCSFSIIIKSLRAGITEQWNTAAASDKIVINRCPTLHRPRPRLRLVERWCSVWSLAPILQSNDIGNTVWLLFIFLKRFVWLTFWQSLQSTPSGRFFCLIFNQTILSFLVGIRKGKRRKVIYKEHCASLSHSSIDFPQKQTQRKKMHLDKNHWQRALCHE